MYLNSKTEKKLTESELNKLFNLLGFEPLPNDNIKESRREEKTPQIYAYFGEDRVIKKNAIPTKSNEGKIISDVLSKMGDDSYLGDITIPKDNQELPFFDSTQVKNKKCRDNIEISSKGYYKFKKLEAEIKDGSFADIRVSVEYEGDIHTFENHIAISFFNYSTVANCNYLFYKQSIINNKPTRVNKMSNLRVRLSDVMNYNYEMGNHYIPHNLVIKLPQKDVNESETNKTSPATYQIKQSTHLDKIVELRAYTDFLSVFGNRNTNNGLVSIEGSAKFYILPFPMKFWTRATQFFLFPVLSPSVRFNKFSDNSTFAEVPAKNYKSPFDLVEKRFLIMSSELVLFQVEHKYFPLKANLYGLFNYNLSRARIVDTIETAKAMGYGGGVNLIVKRFNNFGFSHKTSLYCLDYKNFNSFGKLEEKLPNCVPIFKNESEVFYHPNKNPNQAIFARLNTYNYMGKSNDQSFFQFQFGYKFSIGSRTVRSQ